MSKAAELAALIGSQTALSNRNLIINGAMEVDQRNSGSAVTFQSDGSGVSGFATDRMQFFLNNTGELDLECQQVSDAPAGFAYSLKTTVTTAESSGATPAADDRVSMQVRLEANTTERLALGTSGAKKFVVSFYVKSSLTGNHGVVIASNNNRSYPVLYNIASADTWERKTIVVPGPTDGTWATGTAFNLALKFGLYTGSSRDGPDKGTTGSGTWITDGVAQGVENQVQVGGTLNATWQITGIQLEVGEQATPFEHRSFGDELQRCLRYYYAIADGSASVMSIGNSSYYNNTYINGITPLPVLMRAKPSIEQTTGTNYFKIIAGGASDTFNGFDGLGNTTSLHQAELYASSNLSGTQGHGGIVSSDSSSARLAFSAEL